MEEEYEVDEGATAQAIASLIEISRRLRELSEEAAELCRKPIDSEPTIH